MVTFLIVIDRDFHYGEYVKRQKSADISNFRLSLLYLSHTQRSLVYLVQNNVYLEKFKK